jgi:hypothetical protein
VTRQVSTLYDIREIKNLLEEKDLRKIQELLPELRHNWETQTIWRTETLMRYSVLNDVDCPDNASKYHQAKVEQLVFFEQLFILSLQYQKQLRKIEIKKAEIEELQDRLLEPLKSYEIKKLQANIEIKEIESKELLYELENMRIQARERVREIATWSKIKDELNDGSFDIDDINETQLISLMRRYIQETWHAVSSGGQNDLSSINNILAHYETLGRECISRGLMDEVLRPFKNRGEILDFVNYSLKLK